MLWNTFKDGLNYLQNESVSMEVFLLNIHETMDFTWSGQSYMSFNLLGILNFICKNFKKKKKKTTGLAYPQAVNVEKASAMGT